MNETRRQFEAPTCIRNNFPPTSEISLELPTQSIMSFHRMSFQDTQIELEIVGSLKIPPYLRTVRYDKRFLEFLLIILSKIQFLYISNLSVRKSSQKNARQGRIMGNFIAILRWSQCRDATFVDRKRQKPIFTENSKCARWTFLFRFCLVFKWRRAWMTKKYVTIPYIIIEE